MQFMNSRLSESRFLEEMYINWLARKLSRRTTVGTATKVPASLILFFTRSSDKAKSYIFSILNAR